MATTRITFDDKIPILPPGERVNQVWAEDINEIKAAINNNASALDAIPISAPQDLQSVLGIGESAVDQSIFLCEDVTQATHLELHNKYLESASAGGGTNRLLMGRHVSGTTQFSFPEKAVGNYILATTDDIGSGGGGGNVTTYYIDSAVGNNSNAGTKASPFQNFSAVSTLLSTELDSFKVIYLNAATHSITSLPASNVEITTLVTGVILSFAGAGNVVGTGSTSKQFTHKFTNVKLIGTGTDTNLKFIGTNATLIFNEAELDFPICDTTAQFFSYKNIYGTIKKLSMPASNNGMFVGTSGYIDIAIQEFDTLGRVGTFYQAGDSIGNITIRNLHNSVSSSVNKCTIIGGSNNITLNIYNIDNTNLNDVILSTQFCSNVTINFHQSNLGTGAHGVFVGGNACTVTGSLSEDNTKQLDFLNDGDTEAKFTVKNFIGNIGKIQLNDSDDTVLTFINSNVTTAGTLAQVTLLWGYSGPAKIIFMGINTIYMTTPAALVVATTSTSVEKRGVIYSNATSLGTGISTISSVTLL